MAQEVRVPDIGDFDAVEVIEILAAAGDAVTADDPLVVIESDKASMEIPAGVAGVVESVLVSLGDQVGEGSLIATIGAAGGAAVDTAAPPADASPATPDTADEAVAEAPEAAAAEPPPAATQTLEVRVPDIGDAKDVVVIEIGVSAGVAACGEPDRSSGSRCGARPN